MFEHRKQALISKKDFAERLGRFAGLAFLLMAGSWFIGILGFHFFEGMSWIDAVLNAAMILSGMGPVNDLLTFGGKLFASLYAIFCGVIFLVAVAVLLAPVVHRLLHKFHIENNIEQ
jgi:hypothetical protein